MSIQSQYCCEIPSLRKLGRGGASIRKVYGHTTGLAAGHIKRLQKLYRRRLPPDVIITPDLSRALARLSFETNRQIGLLINRSGEIERVIVGDHRSILIPELSPARGHRGRLRGLRCVHTHLQAEPISEICRRSLLEVISEIKSIPENRPSPRRKRSFLDELKIKYKRVDEIKLFDGRIIYGAIISRGSVYTVVTKKGTVKIPAQQIQVAKPIR